jgi:hypothetical protein
MVQLLEKTIAVEAGGYNNTGDAALYWRKINL